MSTKEFRGKRDFIKTKINLSLQLPLSRHVPLEGRAPLLLYSPGPPLNKHQRLKQTLFVSQSAAFVVYKV